MRDKYTQQQLEELADTRIKTKALITKDPEVSGRRLRFSVTSRNGFTASEIKQHISALEIGEIVVNSLEYKQWVEAQSFTSTTLTGKQVYDKQMTGEETLQPGHDYTLTMPVTMYEKNNSTVGYTYAQKIMVWVNRKFFRQYDLGGIFGNFWHEGQHKFGFDHQSPSDHGSVPYAAGYKVRDMVNAYVKQGVRYTDLYPVVIEEPGSQAPPIVIAPIEKKQVCKRIWYTLWIKKVCWYE